jgi:hypothetical protein
VAARCPRVIYIRRARRLPAEPALELLISNPLESRAPVAPALVERVSRALVSNGTLRVSDFSSTGLGLREHHAYLGKGSGHLIPTVVATVVRRGRAFSGDATTRVVGVVGGGCDGPSRLFGCRAIMIAHARTLGRFGVVGPARQ